MVVLLVLVYCAVLCWCLCWPLCGFLLSRRRPAKYILNNDDGAAATAAAVSVSAIFTTFGQSVSLKYKCVCALSAFWMCETSKKKQHTYTRGRTHRQTHALADCRVESSRLRETVYVFFLAFFYCVTFFPLSFFISLFFLLAFLSPNTRATHDDSSSLKTIHSG